MIREIVVDFDAHGRSFARPAFWAMAVYRYGRWSLAQPEGIRRFASPVYRTLRLWVELTTGVAIDPRCTLGSGFRIVHAGNIRIHPDVIIGQRCGIMHDVTLGDTIGKPGAPIVGDDVLIGPGAKILGPVRIGDGALIAANSLVITDIPAGATAMGVPARVLPNGTRRPRLRFDPQRNSGGLH